MNTQKYYSSRRRELMKAYKYGFLGATNCEHSNMRCRRWGPTGHLWEGVAGPDQERPRALPSPSWPSHKDLPGLSPGLAGKWESWIHTRTKRYPQEEPRRGSLVWLTLCRGLPHFEGSSGREYLASEKYQAILARCVRHCPSPCAQICPLLFGWIQWGLGQERKWKEEGWNNSATVFLRSTQSICSAQDCLVHRVELANS